MPPLQISSITLSYHIRLYHVRKTQQTFNEPCPDIYFINILIIQKHPYTDASLHKHFHHLFSSLCRSIIKLKHTLTKELAEHGQISCAYQTAKLHKYCCRIILSHQKNTEKLLPCRSRVLCYVSLGLYDHMTTVWNGSEYQRSSGVIRYEVGLASQ